MACQLKDAIALLQATPAAKGKINLILDNNKIMKEKYNSLVKDITSKPASTSTIAELSKGLGSLIRKVTKVKVTDNPQFALEQIKLGMEGIEFARFSVANGIEIAKLPDPGTIATKLQDEFYTKVSSGEISGVNTDGKVLLTEVQRIFDITSAVKGSHFLAHELIHAATLEYMYANTNEPATKRIEEIYTYLMNNHKELGITEGYWQTNVDEFIAEAMSNPKLIKELLAVKPNKPVKRLGNMYEILLSSMLNVLGLDQRKRDNVFNLLLDSTLTILHEGNQANTSSEAQQGTKETQTTTTGKSTPAKDTKPSEASNEAIKYNYSKYDNLQLDPAANKDTYSKVLQHYKDRLGKVQVLETSGVTGKEHETALAKAKHSLDVAVKKLEKMRPKPVKVKVSKAAATRDAIERQANVENKPVSEDGINKATTVQPAKAKTTTERQATESPDTLAEEQRIHDEEVKALKEEIKTHGFNDGDIAAEIADAKAGGVTEIDILKQWTKELLKSSSKAAGKAKESNIGGKQPTARPIETAYTKKIAKATARNTDKEVAETATVADVITELTADVSDDIMAAINKKPCKV